MAQLQRRMPGLMWVRSIANSGLGTPPVETKLVATAYATAIFCGDGLKALADGSLAVAAATESMTHVMLSALNYLDDTGMRRGGRYLPASRTYTGGMYASNPKATQIQVIPVAGQRFMAEVPTAAASREAATNLIGQCVDIIANAGSTLSGQSGWTTDTVANFAAGGASAQLKLVEIPEFDTQGKANDPTQAYWKGIFEVYEIGGLV